MTDGELVTIGGVLGPFCVTGSQGLTGELVTIGGVLAPLCVTSWQGAR
jgi:hypothetical protein